MTAHAQPEAAKPTAPLFEPIARQHELAGPEGRWICRQMKDPSRNGKRRSGAQIIEHMSTDPLVLRAWSPGFGRSQPPISHADFVAALRTWADKGMPCPE